MGSHLFLARCRGGSRFFVRLALLDKFGLGGRRGSGLGGRDDLFLDGGHVGDSLRFVRNELDLVGVREVGYADDVSELEVGDVELKLVGDVGRETLYVDLTDDLIHDAALQADALGDPGEDDGDADGHGLIHGDALEVDVHGGALDGLVLPIHDHGLCGSVSYLEVEDGVVSGLRVQDLGDLLGLDLDGDRRGAGAVNDGRDLSGAAETAIVVLVRATCALCCFNEFLRNHENLFRGLKPRVVLRPVRGAKAPLYREG